MSPAEEALLRDAVLALTDLDLSSDYSRFYCLIIVCFIVYYQKVFNFFYSLKINIFFKNNRDASIHFWADTIAEGATKFVFGID